MKNLLTSMVVATVLAGGASARASFMGDVEKDSAKLEPVMKEAGALLYAGKADEAEAKILAVFPEASRTASQNFLLGNVLYGQDHALSYKLHNQAATAMANEPAVAYEWAMELHRNGEWDTAAEMYRRVIAKTPGDGIPHGLLAECLIRTGHTAEAVSEWQKSEQGHGSLEKFESIACELHTKESPDQKRTALVKKTVAGNADAAVQLVELDCNFPKDWWNDGPDERRLSADLDLVEQAKFTDPRRKLAVMTAIHCGLILTGQEKNAGELLTNAKFLTDDGHSIPESGKLLGVMLAAAESGGALDKETARKTIGPAVLAVAKKSKDPAMYNVAANLAVGTPQLAEIDQAGWDDTGDARFAASRIFGLASAKKLKAGDPLLARAVKEFPDDAMIAQINMILSAKDGVMPEPLVVAAIKAEFTHFSTGGPLQMRPSATPLRAYFSLLGKQMKVSARSELPPKFEVRDTRLDGSTLRVLLETSRQYQEGPQQGPMTADDRGWLVSIDLTAASDKKAASVVGPLWDVPAANATIFFPAGSMLARSSYESRKVDATTTAPLARFDHAGTVFKVSQGDKPETLLRCHLAASGNGSVWKDDENVPVRPGYSQYPKYAVKVDSLDGRYELTLPESGDAVLTDNETGKTVDDPWLTKAVTRFRDIPHWDIVRYFLTNDLKYLVCSPADSVNIDRVYHTTFDLNGQTYDRARFGIVWTRDAANPTVFNKRDTHGKGMAFGDGIGVSAALTVEGRLFLYYVQPDQLLLDPTDGGTAFHVPRPTGTDGNMTWAPLVFYDEPGHRVGLNITSYEIERTGADPALLIWDFKAGSTSTVLVPVKSIFQEKEHRLEPKAATAVGS